MSLRFLDPYRALSSPIHALDARVKVAFALAFILLVNLTPIESWGAFLAYLLVLLGIIGLARLSPGSVLGRSMLALPFVLMAALGLPFIREGRPFLELPLPWGRLIVTDVGALRFANALARAWLSVLISVTLILTTHFVEILRGLRSLGVPAALNSILLLMYRYLYVLVDEAQRLMRARDARSAEGGDGRSGGSLLWRAQVTGRMIGALFLRTYERSERIYQAMLARGFDGEIRVLGLTRPAWRDMVLAGAGIVILLGVTILANVYR